MINARSVFLKLNDKSLEERLRDSILDADSQTLTVLDTGDAAADIAVIDDADAMSQLPGSSIVIFTGDRPVRDDAESPPADDYYFACCEPDIGHIQHELRRACDYIEVGGSNLESKLDGSIDDEALSAALRPLSRKIREMTVLLEMRDTLLDQLPVGILGVDDTNMVVMANGRARDILHMSKMPIYGVDLAMLYNGDLARFMRSDDTEIVVDDRVRVRKSRFMLKKQYAGHIFVLWECAAEQG